MYQFIEDLEKVLINKGYSKFNLYNPGVSDQELKNFIETLYGNTVTIPTDVMNLYRWKNGVNEFAVNDDSAKFAYLADEIYFNSITTVKEVIEGYDFYNFIDEKLLPIFSSLNGEFLAIKLSSEPKIYYCATFDPELEPITSMFDSLNSMFVTLKLLYEKHYFILAEDGLADSNLNLYEDYLRIGKATNPNSEFWKIKLEEYDG